MSPGAPSAAASRCVTAGAVVVLVAAVAVMLGVGMPVALGAEPSALPVEVLSGGDPRSEGTGPGLVGSPLLILAGVALLGLATALVTVAVVRLRGRR